jgi:hypothetical protein
MGMLLSPPAIEGGSATTGRPGQAEVAVGGALDLGTRRRTSTSVGIYKSICEIYLSKYTLILKRTGIGHRSNEQADGRYYSQYKSTSVNHQSNGDWACSPMVGRSSGTLHTNVQILVLAPFPGFFRIYWCYALSGK